jgi:hypothetical protein
MRLQVAFRALRKQPRVSQLYLPKRLDVRLSAFTIDSSLRSAASPPTTVFSVYSHSAMRTPRNPHKGSAATATVNALYACAGVDARKEHSVFVGKIMMTNLSCVFSPAVNLLMRRHVCQRAVHCIFVRVQHSSRDSGVSIAAAQRSVQNCTTTTTTDVWTQCFMNDLQH